VPVAEGAPADDVLFDLVGDAHFVLIGEASHGTGEFYTARAQMTRRLIEERGFYAVAAEADWPDAYRVNRYVRGRGEDATAEEALRSLERFPTWMWRNAAVLDFVGWLRGHNDRSSRDERAKAGFYGLDLYSRRRRGMAPRHRRCSFSGVRFRRELIAAERTERARLRSGWPNVWKRATARKLRRWL
jgi:erythromycin esterase-like protein